MISKLSNKFVTQSMTDNHPITPPPELVEQWRDSWHPSHHGLFAFYIATHAARWGRPAAAPVPVSERLPGPEDCDAEGLCWLWERDCGYSGRKWALVDQAWSLSQSDEDLPAYTHWLPAHALPVPTVAAVM
jgi:hypothetical protein